jgi:hypothetical protein
MTPCRRVHTGQLATVKQHPAAGDEGHLVCGSICVSGDRCSDAAGFSLSTRRQCNGRRQAEKAGVTLHIARPLSLARLALVEDLEMPCYLLDRNYVRIDRLKTT